MRYLLPNLILLIIFLGINFPVLSIDNAKFCDSIAVENDTVIVKLSKKKFNSKKHSISNRRVDKVLSYGIKRNIPEYEFGYFSVLWNHKKLKIKKHLYSDCYEPCLDTACINIAVSEDKKMVIIKMQGGQGVNPYTVEWSISKNGKKNIRAIKDN